MALWLNVVVKRQKPQHDVNINKKSRCVFILSSFTDNTQLAILIFSTKDLQQHWRLHWSNANIVHSIVHSRLCSKLLWASIFSTNALNAPSDCSFYGLVWNILNEFSVPRQLFWLITLIVCLRMGSYWQCSDASTMTSWKFHNLLKIFLKSEMDFMQC